MYPVTHVPVIESESVAEFVLFDGVVITGVGGTDESRVHWTD